MADTAGCESWCSTNEKCTVIQTDAERGLYPDADFVGPCHKGACPPDDGHRTLSSVDDVILCPKPALLSSTTQAQALICSCRHAWLEVCTAQTSRKALTDLLSDVLTNLRLSCGMGLSAR